MSENPNFPNQPDYRPEQTEIVSTINSLPLSEAEKQWLIQYGLNMEPQETRQLTSQLTRFNPQQEDFLLIKRQLDLYIQKTVLEKLGTLTPSKDIQANFTPNLLNYLKENFTAQKDVLLGFFLKLHAGGLTQGLSEELRRYIKYVRKEINKSHTAARYLKYREARINFKEQRKIPLSPESQELFSLLEKYQFRKGRKRLRGSFMEDVKTALQQDSKWVKRQLTRIMGFEKREMEDQVKKDIIYSLLLDFYKDFYSLYVSQKEMMDK